MSWPWKSLRRRSKWRIGIARPCMERAIAPGLACINCDLDHYGSLATGCGSCA
jgi:hypothetical protein